MVALQAGVTFTLTLLGVAALGRPVLGLATLAAGAAVGLLVLAVARPSTAPVGRVLRDQVSSWQANRPVEDDSAAWSIDPHRLRDLSRRQWVGMALLLALVLLTGAQVVRNLSDQQAVVVGDEALIALEAHDVLDVVPTTGKVTSAVLYGNLTLPKNPGPAESWTLAPFVWALGTSLGSWVYAYVVNLGCALLAAWAGFRRGGPRLGIVVLTVCLVMFAMTAPGGVSSVLNTRIVLMPMFASLVLAAFIALGDSVLLPALVAVSSFVIQTHIGYAPVTATALMMAVAIVVWHRLHRPRPPHLGWHLLIAAGVGLAAWALPIHDQLFGTGNLADLASAQVPHSGAARAVDALATLVNPRLIFFTTGELSSDSYGGPSWLVAVLLLTAAAWVLWRHQARLAQHKELLALAGACMLAAALTAALTPPTDTAGEHFYWIRAVSFFLLVVPLLLLTASAAGDREGDRGRPVGAILGTVVVLAAIAPLWVAKDHTPTDDGVMAAVNALLPEVETAAAGPEPLALAHQGYWPAISAADGLLAELADRSIPVRQIDGTTSLPGHRTLVVTQGPPRLGDPVATAPAPAVDTAGSRRLGIDLVPEDVAKWARAHGPIELVGPGRLSLADALDGTATELCTQDFLDDPDDLLALDPSVIADLYRQQQIAAPQLPAPLALRLNDWAARWPTQLHLAPPQAPGEPDDDLILSTSSC